ncbi:MAG: hypothetical protein K0R68_1098 [Mycobacterium sp.]|nr:hypothetical protein [Mycobacterium sp.]
MKTGLSLFWRYVRIQLMMFVFGIVGPIFLVVYFATQPDPTLKWMYWWGLFITAGDVLLALWLTSGLERSTSDVSRRLESASRLGRGPGPGPGPGRRS